MQTVNCKRRYQHLSSQSCASANTSPRLFRQRVNGNWIDRATFLAGILLLRKNTEHATTTVLHELVEGSRYSERHVIALVMRDGRRIVKKGVRIRRAR
jgi:hypothetical protein